MLRNRNSSPTPVRQRRHQYQRPPPASSPTFSFNNVLPRSGGPGASLELSMHLPANSSSNRFDALRSLDTSPQPSREYRVGSSHRRVRNSRGTREAKRRRDARRGRRKQAIQLFDEQLSRGIDAALANVAPFPQRVQTTTPLATPWPTTSIGWPRPTCLPSSPPQLPLLDFSGFNVKALTDLARSFRSPTPVPTPSAISRVPSWCPTLPSLIRNDIWLHDRPIFYDLSGLPEPRVVEVQEPSACRALQVRRSNVYLKTRKQSRFFPPQSTSPTPRVRLPPVACRLHPLDSGSPKVSTVELQIAGRETKVTSNEVLEKVQETSKEATTIAPVGEPSAANLWHILTSGHGVTNAEIHDPYLASFYPAEDEDPAMSTFETPGPTHDQNDLRSSPAELDGREMPYVHANSLTGYANEIALSPYAEEHPSLRDSGICITPLPEPPCSLNELMVDHDHPCDMPVNHPELDAERKPKAPLPSRITSPSYILSDVLPIDCVEEDGGAGALRRSDAQFQSEQELFELPVSPAASPERSAIDIASFLKLGHANNCWCGECNDQPEPAACERPDAESLEDLDDGWTLCSTTEGPDSEWSTATQPAVEVGREERRLYSRSNSSTSDWDEVGSCQPSPLWETVVMKNTGKEVVDHCGWEWDFDCEF